MARLKAKLYSKFGGVRFLGRPAPLAPFPLVVSLFFCGRVCVGAVRGAAVFHVGDASVWGVAAGCLSVRCAVSDAPPSAMCVCPCALRTGCLGLFMSCLFTRVWSSPPRIFKWRWSLHAGRPDSVAALPPRVLRGPHGPLAPSPSLSSVCLCPYCRGVPGSGVWLCRTSALPLALTVRPAVHPAGRGARVSGLFGAFSAAAPGVFLTFFFFFFALCRPSLAGTTPRAACSPARRPRSFFFSSSSLCLDGPGGRPRRPCQSRGPSGGHGRGPHQSRCARAWCRPSTPAASLPLPSLPGPLSAPATVSSLRPPLVSPAHAPLSQG